MSVFENGYFSPFRRGTFRLYLIMSCDAGVQMASSVSFFSIEERCYGYS